MRALIPFAFALLAAPPVLADTALVIANGAYETAQDLRHADEIAALEGPLGRAGFDVIMVEDGTVEAMRAGLSALLEADETDRVLIAVAGHVARSRTGTWVLGAEVEVPDLATVGAAGVSLDVLMEVAGRAPGRALVLLGTEPRRIELGAGLGRGIGPVSAPQGVTVLTGAPDDLAGFARRVALQPGADLAAAIEGSRSLRGHGFLSSSVPFLDVVAEGSDQPGAPPPPDPEEVSLWRAVQELDTAGAYGAYLEQYPEGAFRAEAEAALAQRDATPVDPLAAAEAVEDALGLGRAQRQQIQRDLTILDYNTRGIDGIFGPGTRGAIRAWQGAARFDVTGFLTGPQIGVLREAAAQRAMELEEEARRQREAEERADRAFWQAIGQGRDEAGLRAYLERYPEGLFSDIAETRLAEIEAARRAEAEAEERASWDAARQVDSVQAYRRYMEAYPGGLFADQARARIAVLESGLSPQELARAEAGEAALNLTGQMRLLAEQRLDRLGFDPGRIDGTFDARTRQAIRGFQRSRGLSGTGYLDQLTVVRLLAEAIGGRIFD